MVKRAVVLGLIPLFVFLSTSPLSSQTRESWQKLERNGQGYGYDHIIAEDLANGDIRYEIYQTIKTDIAGYNPQEITQKGHYLVDKNMNPVALDLQIKFKSRETHIQGEMRDGTLYLTRQVNRGEIQKQEIPFDGVYFEVVLGNVIFQKKDLGNFGLKVFNPVEGKVNEYDVEVIPDDKGSIIAKVRERITMIFYIDKKGLVKQIKFVELNSRSYVTTARNARRINYLNTADGLTLTVLCKPQFTNVWNISNAQISIKWKGIPFEQFRFTDNRQRAIEKAQYGNEYEAVIEIRKPHPPSMETVMPVQDGKYALYLKDTEYIKPTDPAIQKQLVEIQGDEKVALSLVKKILLWVYENIGTEYLAETLSGPEVLKRKRGKCVEFSILFASLTRAAGIPTRVAFGEAINGKNWVGHMWCEVWLGDWIAVDAAAGILVENPSHIKFIDSPTVMGTQKIRWKLVDNLGIEILNIQK
ncbi:MAG: transglutaminase domain-containing protein [Candidatus Aminicenantes bacterium]|nr:MAG: transglutaminase domain-containing protein [Candidatus Aminicenantes bacterium]